MEVPIDPQLAAAIFQQVKQRNAVQTEPFRQIVVDYQAVLHRCRELQVRKGQLEKEAGELRLENHSLAEQVAANLHAAASSEQMVALTAKLKEVEMELHDTWKAKAKLAEECMAATKQLGIVRENNEQQSKQLDEHSAEIKDLKVKLRDLRDQLDQERAAHALGTAELEARLKDKEAAEARAGQLEGENADLVRRLVELKSSEIERLNETNRMCDEMLANARNLERAAAASAAAAAAASQQQGRRHRGPSLSLLDQMKGLTRANSTPQSRVPKSALKSTAAHDGGCFALAFDRSGSRLASGGADKTVKIWEPATGNQISVLHGMLETVLEVSFTCDQRQLVAAGSDSALRMWEVDSGRSKHTLTGHTAKVSSVDCSPTEATRAISAGTDRCMKIWDLQRGYCLRTIICHSTCNSLRCTRDGAMICSGHFDGTLRFWDMRSPNKMVHEVSGLHAGAQLCSVAVGSHGGTVLTCGKDNMLKLVDIRTFQVQHSLRAPGFVVGTVWCTASMGPDERHVAAGSTDGSVFVWEVEKGEVVTTLKEPSAQSILATCWSPQGTPLVSSDKAGLLMFWNG
ncbi:hypothetical protein WJX72_002152 [[Myrmecia] bisecta]|uniref:Autophagy-related protein 16 domain-containing protein n=1 Tax=[Myrmecia] bisecta TaxID=41462 RepID=A0AAW1R5N5_9CHLO